MGEDERAGTRTGPVDTKDSDIADAGVKDNEGPNRRGRGRLRMSGYVLRAVLSVGALACAVVVVVGLGGVAAPLPDRGLIQPVPAGIAAPAALPTVPEPVRSELVPLQPPPAAAEEPAEPVTLPGTAPEVAYSGWAARVAPVTGIPERALQAYANAHAAMASTEAGCQLTWVTLAGIARIESDHGQIGGRTLNAADGRPSVPIVGIPLNGGPGVRSIADTDGGLLDGDTVWDRAVGPFQFIPSTWAGWLSDGDGDGIANPQDIDDAAIAAARYLCAGGRNLSTGEGWLGAILSYNDSVEYVQSVYTSAQAYARSAQGIS